jgi:hypothetical protein
MSKPLSAAVAWLVGFAALLLSICPVQATTFPPVGRAGGDRAEEVRCPQRELLVGFHGRWGDWIDQIGLICARPQELRPMNRLHARGGSGGGPEERYCEPRAAIKGVTLWAMRDYVGGLALQCAFLGGGTSQRHIFGIQNKGSGPYHQFCPDNEFATGVTLYYGRHVNALGLICGSVSTGVGNAGSAGNAMPPAERVDASMENNTDRPGSDFDRFHINDYRPDRCQSECLLKKDRCKAWTYVRPGIQHKYAVCYLKNAVPAAVSNTCCISGVLPNKSRTGITQGPGGIAPPPVGSPPVVPPALPTEPASNPPSTPETVPTGPSANPNEPYGAIGDKYAALGGAGGPLGSPTGSEADAPHGGRCHQFRGGAICWHPQIGEAFGVWGLIHAKWAQMGRTEFGYPITDERPTSDGRGRYNHFRGMQYPGRPEASIFWTPQTGAHAIYGAIRDAWAQQGWERGPLGYPTSDEHQDGKYRRVNFERGSIRWAPDTGIEIMR